MRKKKKKKSRKEDEPPKFKFYRFVTAYMPRAAMTTGRRRRTTERFIWEGAAIASYLVIVYVEED